MWLLLRTIGNIGRDPNLAGQVEGRLMHSQLEAPRPVAESSQSSSERGKGPGGGRQVGMDDGSAKNAKTTR